MATCRAGTSPSLYTMICRGSLILVSWWVMLSFCLEWQWTSMLTAHFEGWESRVKLGIRYHMVSHCTCTPLWQLAIQYLLESSHGWPRVGGMFEYVSGANYFGESLEWTGYAIACWSWPGAIYAVWSTLFLGSRAIQHHRQVCRTVMYQKGFLVDHNAPPFLTFRWYLVKFEDYPRKRKAFIPFLL